MRSLTDGPVRTFGHAGHADVRVTDLTLDRFARPTFTLSAADATALVTLPLVGAHQALNASAAVAAGMAAGMSLGLAAAALSDVSLSKWRLEVRELASGATLLNDSYNAHPESTIAGLDALAAVEGARRIAVLGEMLELGENTRAEHRAVGKHAATCADVVVAVGEGARSIAQGGSGISCVAAQQRQRRRLGAPPHRGRRRRARQSLARRAP